MKEIKPAPARTDNVELNKIIDQIRQALEEIYIELKRLEKAKQDV